MLLARHLAPSRSLPPLVERSILCLPRSAHFLLLLIAFLLASFAIHRGLSQTPLDLHPWVVYAFIVALTAAIYKGTAAAVSIWLMLVFRTPM